ncbi:unnamed protein product [Lepidochelys olivacea]
MRPMCNASGRFPPRGPMTRRSPASASSHRPSYPVPGQGGGGAGRRWGLSAAPGDSEPPPGRRIYSPFVGNEEEPSTMYESNRGGSQLRNCWLNSKSFFK